MEKAKQRLGIDVGRVIMDGTKEDIKGLAGKEVPLGESFLSISPVRGAFDGVRKLVGEFGADNVWLVSTCSESMESKTRIWLEHQHFFEKTGVLRQNLVFCRKRRDKGYHATERELTHFVDDHAEVLAAMPEFTKHLFLFRPGDEEMQNFPDVLQKATKVQNWPDLLEAIQATLKTKT